MSGDSEVIYVDDSDSDIELNGSPIPIRTLSQFNWMSPSNSNWHQIIVKHEGRYTKPEIVAALFYNFIVEQNFDPFYLCYYKVGTTEDSFLLRNHYQHLKILATNRMSLTIKNDGIKMKLFANVAAFKKEIHVSEELITRALRERYNDGVLDLTNFELSNTLKDKLILNTSLPKVYFKLIAQTFSNFGNITKINLSQNGISNGAGLKILKKILTLKSLNLSNNKFTTLMDLSSIKKIKIIELWLEGNPLCAKYVLCGDYISDIKSVFPKINVLDGVTLALPWLQDLFFSKKNYLCNMEAFDLIEQFVGNYFKIFDSQNKEELIRWYGSNSVFTLSTNSKRDVRKKPKDWPSNISRNLIPSAAKDKKKDITKIMDCTKNVFVGSNISHVLKSLPKFQHNLYSFTTDVHFYKPELVILTITGVVMVLGNPSTRSTKYYAFSRNFILKRSPTKIGIFSPRYAYEITNDQLALTDISAEQLKRTFRFQIHEDNHSAAPTDADKRALLIMFQVLTNLNIIWCIRILETADYNFKKSLEIFLDLMTREEIPASAFCIEQEEAI